MGQTDRQTHEDSDTICLCLYKIRQASNKKKDSVFYHSVVISYPNTDSKLLYRITLLLYGMFHMELSTTLLSQFLFHGFKHSD